MELNFATLATIIGILGGILGILNQLSNLRKGQEDNIKAQAVRDQKLDDKLERIDERLEAHNEYAEKFANLSSTIIEMQTDIKWIKERK